MSADQKTSESEWEVVSSHTLIPVGVTLHNDKTGMTLSVPTLYDSDSGDVYVLGEHQFLYDESVAATKGFMEDRKRWMKDTALIDDAVDQNTWDQIKVLTGMTKPNREF